MNNVKILEAFQCKTAKIADHCADLVDFYLMKLLSIEIPDESDAKLEDIYKYINKGMCLLDHVTNLLERIDQMIERTCSRN